MKRVFVMAKQKMKKESVGGEKICNVCESNMNEIKLYMCPHCQITGENDTCDNCNSKMNEVLLLTCPNCGNTIDEQTLKEKQKLKQRFDKLK